MKPKTRTIPTINTAVRITVMHVIRQHWNLPYVTLDVVSSPSIDLKFLISSIPVYTLTGIIRIIIVTLVIINTADVFARHTAVDGTKLARESRCRHVFGQQRERRAPADQRSDLCYTPWNDPGTTRGRRRGPYRGHRVTDAHSLNSCGAVHRRG